MAMKNFYYFLTILLFFNWNVNAQFTWDFETCILEGEPSPGGSGYWTDWGCGGGPGCQVVCSTEHVNSGDWAGLIPGDNSTDTVLDLGNRIFAQWGLEFWMYIPLNKEGVWNIEGTIPIGAGESIVGNVFFNQDGANPGVGLIEDTALGALNFNFPHDEWFKVVMNWDISLGIGASTWQLNVDGINVVPFGTPFTNFASPPSSPTYPTSLGGIRFFSISTDNELYLDDFGYQNSFIILDTEDFSKINFIIYPNPTQSILNIDTQETIKSSRIYNILGIIVKETVGLNSIDISSLTSGIYFIEVSTKTGRSIQKFIKN